MWTRIAIAVVVAAAIAGAAGGAGWQVRDWKAKADQAAVTAGLLRAQQMQKDRADKAATNYETLRAQREVVNRQIDKETFDVVEAPVYRNECIDADGLRLISDALAGSAASPSVPASAVPRAGSTD